MTAPRKTIIFYAADAPFFVSHRLNLVSGAEWTPWTVQRGGMSVFGEARALLHAFSILRRTRPSVIHAIAIKPILYTGIAAKFLHIPVVGAVSGRGYTGTGGGRKGVLRRAINIVMRFGLNRRDVSFIFQNGDDARMVEFAKLDRVSVHNIGGSGVDLSRITMQLHPTGMQTRIGLPARLLRDKGVYEFVEAARILRGRGREATFLLIGDPDPSNPTSVSRAEIEAWVAEGVVQWIPHTADVASVLATLHIVALPSYREGFPKTLIDAAAAGRASVTSDVPGCRDAIVDGVTGLLCPAMDSGALADALDRLVLDRRLCVEMGGGRRQRACGDLFRYCRRDVSSFGYLS